EYALNYWKDNGAPAQKLLVGFPAYGKTFTLQNPSDTSVGAPASGPGPAGPYTREGGILAYYEICTFLNSGATQAWDEPQDVPYTYKGSEWVGYDNEKSFGLKVEWLKNNNFGGALVWTIDLDDFTGTFCNEGKYPLISTLKKSLGLENSSIVTPTKPLPPTNEAPTTTSGSGFCAGKPNGLYPDPENKRNFYNCVDGRTILQSCPDSLVFDPACSCCNWP
ncbi:CHIA chitinase, partial [Calyptomena viridis]|nr:CHIA chitinase [Calyptomena viridis]